MIYAISDLHGCYGEYREMLRKIRFIDTDTLYILGDIVDRGPEPMKILLDVAKRKNVVFIKGNHDFYAKRLLLKYGYPDKSGNCKAPLTVKEKEEMKHWEKNGGANTLKSFRRLSPEEKETVLSVLDKAILYKELTVNGRSFFLSHTVPAKEKFKHFKDLKVQDFIRERPDFRKEYTGEKNRFVIIGHSPTAAIDERSAGRIYKSGGLIVIDLGCVFGYGLGCIALDTMEEYYVPSIS